MQQRDIRMSPIDHIRGIILRAVHPPARRALVRDRHMVGFGDFEVGRDGHEGSAETGVGDHGAVVGAEEADAEILDQVLDLADDGGGVDGAVGGDGEGVDVPGGSGRAGGAFDGGEDGGGVAVEGHLAAGPGRAGRRGLLLEILERPQRADGAEAVAVGDGEAGYAGFGAGVEHAGGFEFGAVVDGGGEFALGVNGLTD